MMDAYDSRRAKEVTACACVFCARARLQLFERVAYLSFQASFIVSFSGKIVA